jgi:anti-sigma B factor antagonist
MVGKDLLNVETTLRTGTTAAVELRGELDVGTENVLRAHLTALINEGVRTFVLDLAHLEFVDSTGLAVFVEMDRVLRRLGGSLALSKAEGQPYKVMELTGILRALAGGQPDPTRPAQPTR